jgi:formate hydrogenlyase subunit 3/multisubunit Na+/H+ antiporter MnhD subunit
MTFMVLALAVWVVSGLGACLASRSRTTSSSVAVLGTVFGGILAAVPAARVLAGREVLSFRAPWSVPWGELALRLDGLSAWFVLVIVFVSVLAAVYGAEYLASAPARKSLGPSWFFFNLLVASMVLVVLASNAVLFLVAWELMALASFFLVTFEDEQESVRQAGWVYLVATHLGAAWSAPAAWALTSTPAGWRNSDNGWNRRFAMQPTRSNCCGIRPPYARDSRMPAP